MISLDVFFFNFTYDKAILALPQMYGMAIFILNTKELLFINSDNSWSLKYLCMKIAKQSCDRLGEFEELPCDLNMKFYQAT